ncbi:four and a half LIM domains protein 2-like [Ambystoma mexicanum]|uniref:four and a half LIM domains protein 2-like n=1 Tax=Ambystoma mexicanum TaxID=8296 RepID=UPI0037E8DA02
MSNKDGCHHCRTPLSGVKYTVQDDDPYCVMCYNHLFANMCEDCNKAIGWDSKDLAYKDRHWHEACFKCAQCSHSLVEKPFAAKMDLLLCLGCYSDEYSSKCFSCKNPIMPGSRKVEFNGNSWHETCFICKDCKQPIGAKSFIPKDSEDYCLQCFERQFASQCKSCKKAITTEGVTYQGQPWHKECFLCSRCQKQLAGQKCTSRDKVIYCLDCFSALYSRRCVACAKPIASDGVAKYVSFEAHEWHSDCFSCTKCEESLVGKRFIKNQESVFCLECAKGLHMQA